MYTYSFIMNLNRNTFKNEQAKKRGKLLKIKWFRMPKHRKHQKSTMKGNLIRQNKRHLMVSEN